jgi:hypothetical protein
LAKLLRIWTGMRTRNVTDGGTDSLVALTIDGVQLTFFDSFQDDQERGGANVYEKNVTTNNVLTENLNNSSVRMAILGDDAWRPEDIFVWGEIPDNGIIPLAMETEIQNQLSTDPNEGNAGLPLRLVGRGGLGTVINRLLVLMTTADDVDAGTDDKINLTITRPGGIRVVDVTFPDTPQPDQETSQANIYVVPVDVPFTKDGFSDTQPVRLSTDGNNAWLPASFFIFGLDTAQGRPNLVVPLVHLRQWNLGSLSQDTTEGQPSITLPFLP